MKKSIALGLGILLLAIAGGIAFDMKRLAAQEMLWGYRPLWLLLAAWGGLVMLWSGLFVKNRGWRWLGLSALSSVLLAVGFPDIIAAPWLLFVGFVPLLLVEAEIREQGGARQKRYLLLIAYQTFVLWNIITTYWVTNSAIGAGLFAILVNSMLMCIPFMLFHLTAKNAPRLGYAAFIFYWITFEYGHQNWDLTWPWLTLGNGFAEYYHWVQWYEYSGTFGGTLWVLLMNVLVLHLLRHYWTTKKIRWDKGVQAMGVLLIPIIISLFMYQRYEEEGHEVEIVVVQPNYEPHYQKFSLPEPQQIQQFIALTEKAITENTEYVIFPESSFGYVEVDNMATYGSIRELRTYFEQYPNVKLVTGINAYNIFEDNEPHSEAVRKRTGRDGQLIYFETLNAAIQLDPKQDSIPLYKKSKLVPGAEAFPFKTLLFFMEPLVEQLGGTTAGIGIQPQRSVFASEAGKVAPVICYESIFGEYYTGYIRKGAQAGFIMTNDGWWDNTAGHRQHLMFASLRAVETRRSMARSANTGISAFINQRGDILQPTKYDEAIAIRGTILMNDRITFYTIWGDMIARLSVFITIIFLLNTFVKSRMKD